jgi:hypothetical protein
VCALVAAALALTVVRGAEARAADVTVGLRVG